MRNVSGALAGVAIALLVASSPARADCVPATPATGALPFLFGIEPSDTPLDVWCRVQRGLPAGEYEMNVFFGGAKVGRTTKIAFDGTTSRSKEDFAVYLQSLLPTTLVDLDSGTSFPQVLENVVQASAGKTGDGTVLGLPEPYARSKDLVLWEPLSIGIKPVNLGGVMFKMFVTFKPSAGQFFAGLDGQGESMVFKGWHDYVLRHVDPSAGRCSALIPSCEDLGETIPLRAAWVLDSVALVADGRRLSEAAYMVLGGIEKGNRDSVKSSNLRRFDPTVGAGQVTVVQGARSIEAKAVGSKDKTSGTSSISVVYREDPKNKASYRYGLEDYAAKFRNALISAYPDQ